MKVWRTWLTEGAGLAAFCGQRIGIDKEMEMMDEGKIIPPAGAAAVIENTGQLKMEFPPTQNEKEQEAVIEAVLFTMGRSVELRQLAAAIGQDKETALNAVERLKARYDRNKHCGMQIIVLEDSYQMSTKSKYYDNLIRVAATPKKQVLTEVVLETLSIIAYKQPVTKLEIEKIRGVKSDHAVNRLVEYNLVYEVGRMDAPGRPALFATTEEFLRRFGVGSTDDLPSMNPEQAEEIKAEVEEELQLKLEDLSVQEGSAAESGENREAAGNRAGEAEAEFGSGVPEVPEVEPGLSALESPEAEPGPGAPEGPEVEPSPGAPEGLEVEPSPGAPEGPEVEPSPGAPEGPEVEPSRGASEAPEVEPSPSAPEGPEVEPSPGAPEGPEVEPSLGAPEAPEVEPSPGAPEGQEAEPSPSAPEAPEVEPGSSAPKAPEVEPSPSASEAPEVKPSPSAPEAPEAEPAPGHPPAEPAPEFLELEFEDEDEEAGESPELASREAAAAVTGKP